MSLTPTHFLLCPTCSRSVPASTAEKYCPNDGTKLLECCPCCERPILTPFARFCAGCGFEFAKLALLNLNPSSQPTLPNTESPPEESCEILN